MPRVLNKYKDTIPQGAIYIGRGSPWGNPFTHLESNVPGTIQVIDRATSIVNYNAWIYRRFKMEQEPPSIALIKKKLRNKDLVCFCAPKQCHGDLLLRIANEPEEK